VTVWIIEGWFGDVEWIEAIYATGAAAEKRVDELRVRRRSSVLPDDHWIQGLAKFAAVEHKVLT
jgi:hypothetical protein